MTAIANAPAPAPTPAPTRTSAWYVVGAVFGALMVLTGAVSFAGLVARHQDGVDWSAPATARLVVQLGSGSVRIQGGDRDGFVGSAQRTWSFTRPELVTTAGGDTTTLRVDCGWVSTGYCDTDLELTVPRGTAVVVDDDSGDVQATGLTADATFTTNSGRVTATGLTGDLTAAADSGDLVVTGQTGDLDLRVDSGHIDVRDTTASDVTARASSGDIRLDLAGDADAVEAHASSGNVTVLLPDTPDVAYRLDLRSGSGATSGSVRTDPASPRTVAASASSGNVTVAYRDR